MLESSSRRCYDQSDHQNDVCVFLNALVNKRRIGLSVLFHSNTGRVFRALKRPPKNHLRRVQKVFPTLRVRLNDPPRKEGGDGSLPPVREHPPRSSCCYVAMYVCTTPPKTRVQPHATTAARNNSTRLPCVVPNTNRQKRKVCPDRSSRSERKEGDCTRAPSLRDDTMELYNNASLQSCTQHAAVARSWPCAYKHRK